MSSPHHNFVTLNYVGKIKFTKQNLSLEYVISFDCQISNKLTIFQEDFQENILNRGICPTPEFKFHPTRKWRIDYFFCNPISGIRIALEVEGGVWGVGRHNRPSGFIKDMEKYNALNLQLHFKQGCFKMKLSIAVPFSRNTVVINYVWTAILEPATIIVVIPGPNCTNIVFLALPPTFLPRANRGSFSKKVSSAMEINGWTFQVPFWSWINLVNCYHKNCYNAKNIDISLVYHPENKKRWGYWSFFKMYKESFSIHA